MGPGVGEGESAGLVPGCWGGGGLLKPSASGSSWGQGDFKSRGWVDASSLLVSVAVLLGQSGISHSSSSLFLKLKIGFIPFIPSVVNGLNKWLFVAHTYLL